MTKSELIEAIAARGDLTKARAELVVNCVFDAMTDALRRGEGIEIRGFGSFSVRPYKPYAGRNPRTGNPVPVSAKKLPFFKVGKELRELVDNSRLLNHPLSEGSDDDGGDDELDHGAQAEGKDGAAEVIAHSATAAEATTGPNAKSQRTATIARDAGSQKLSERESGSH